MLEPLGKDLALGPLAGLLAQGSPLVSWLSGQKEEVIDLPPLGGPGHKSHWPTGVA